MGIASTTRRCRPGDERNVRFFILTVNRLSVACGALAACLIGASILIVCQMVLWRYVLVASTTWQTDFVTFALVGATIVGAPYVLREGGHVKVDLVTNAASPAVRRVLLVISYLTVMAMAAIFAWKGGVLTAEAWHGAWVTDTVCRAAALGAVFGASRRLHAARPAGAGGHDREPRGRRRHGRARSRLGGRAPCPPS